MLIGRQRERDVLGQALAALPQREGRAVFLAGEAGIGKSTLLSALRTEASQRGYVVAFDVGSRTGWSAPYAVWASLLTQVGQPTDLALRPGATLSADEHRLRVHRDVIAAIRDAAKLRPIVLSLDDVQWMDHLSRRLLVQAVRDLGNAPVLIAGSWRTPVPEQETGLWADLSTLRAEPGVHWLDLSGLDATEATTLIGQHGVSPPAPVMREVMRRTDGNPFFVTEIARVLASNVPEQASELVHQVPDTVRQMVRQRILTLAEPTRQMLGVAAIFPRGVDFALLGDITDLDEDALLDAVDDALDHDVLRPSARRAEHYVFAHEMVREAIAASWSDSRRARLHRRVAERTERHFAGRTDLVAGDLALHFAASRSLPGGEAGIPYAMRSAELAAASFDYEQAAAMLTIAQHLAETAPLATQADIAWRRALALADALHIAEAETASEGAVRLLTAAGAEVDVFADACWRLAAALNAIGASSAVRDRVRDAGLRVLGNRRDLAWARLRLLSDAMEVVPHDALYVARWLGYDPEAQRLVRQQGTEDDGVQTLESFDPRTPRETRGLLALARSWQHPRSILRGLTVVGNDLTYRHGEFRLAMKVWGEAFDLAQRVGAVPWQANAINQITLLHVTLGDFAGAVASSHEADAVNALLGPANDAEALHMERDFTLTHVLDGDWPGQAAYWLDFVGNPPYGLETRLAVPLYAAMAASAASVAGVHAGKALRLVDALLDIADIPGIQQRNGVVGWAGDAVFRLQASDRAAALDRLAASLIDAGVGDYPQTSLWLTRARMRTLLGDSNASRMFDMARETLLGSGQAPLHGIACYEQAVAPSTSLRDRQRLLTEAGGVFERLGMTSWRERVTAASSSPVRAHADLAGVSERELEVLRLVAQGFSDRRVADTLFISERTVNAHVRNILRKTDTANRTELTSWAQGRGILDSITTTS